MSVKYVLGEADIKELVDLLKKSRVKPTQDPYKTYSIQNKEFEETKREFLSYFENVLRSEKYHTQSEEHEKGYSENVAVNLQESQSYAQNADLSCSVMGSIC